MKMFAVEAGERSEETGGDGLEDGLFAGAVEGAYSGVAGEGTAEAAEFVGDPNREIIAIAPKVGGTRYENQIAKK